MLLVFTLERMRFLLMYDAVFFSMKLIVKEHFLVFASEVDVCGIVR